LLLALFSSVFVKRIPFAVISLYHPRTCSVVRAIWTTCSAHATSNTPELLFSSVVDLISFVSPTPYSSVRASYVTRPWPSRSRSPRCNNSCKASKDSVCADGSEPTRKRGHRNRQTQNRCNGRKHYGKQGLAPKYRAHKHPLQKVAKNTEKKYMMSTPPTPSVKTDTQNRPGSTGAHNSAGARSWCRLPARSLGAQDRVRRKQPAGANKEDVATIPGETHTLVHSRR